MVTEGSLGFLPLETELFAVPHWWMTLGPGHSYGAEDAALLLW